MFKPNDFVHSKFYGDGTVLKLEAFACSRPVVVQFKDSETLVTFSPEGYYEPRNVNPHFDLRNIKHQTNMVTQ